MTWNTLTNLADQQVVTEEHMDDIRENIEHLGSLKAWGTALSVLSGSDENAGVVGIYTGNGAATLAVTGIGFAPKLLIIYRQATGGSQGMKTGSDGLSTKIWETSGVGYYAVDQIISLDSNGFTVGDGTGTANHFNVSSAVYTYIALGSG